MSVSFNPNTAPVTSVDIKTIDKEEPKTSLFKIPRVKKLILGAFALQAAAMAPKADGAVGSYLACLAACSATTLSPPACAALCTPAFGLPV